MSIDSIPTLDDPAAACRGRKVIVVAGAGMVGTTAALLYANAGYRVDLLDGRPAPRPVAVQVNGQLNVRTVALSHRSIELLRGIGVPVDGMGCEIKTIQVSEQGAFGAVRMYARDFHLPALGRVLPNAELENNLLARARNHSLITVQHDAAIVQVTQYQESVSVNYRSAGTSRKVLAKMVIAADGSESATRQLLGIDTRRADYAQSAIVANVHCSLDHEYTAFERFTEQGPLAMLPIGRRCMAMVWTLSEQQAGRFMRLTDDAFLAQLQQRFGGRLGRQTAVGHRHALPLSLIEAEQQVMGRCVLLGNAARTIHPVAGQGMNLALRDVFQLLGSVAGSSDGWVDPASEAVFEHFTARRKSDQRRVVQQTDVLAKLYRRHPTGLNGLVRGLRRGALLALDFASPLRNGFAALNAGIGIALDLPQAGLPTSEVEFRDRL